MRSCLLRIILVLVYIYQAPLNYIDLSWMGLGGISGIMAVFITVVILNTLQGSFDAGIPFLIFRRENLLALPLFLIPFRFTIPFLI